MEEGIAAGELPARVPRRAPGRSTRSGRPRSSAWRRSPSPPLSGFSCSCRRSSGTGRWRLSSSSPCPPPSLAGRSRCWPRPEASSRSARSSGSSPCWASPCETRFCVVSRNRHLEDTGQAFDAALVARATEERAAPILMSAIGTALVFLPIAVLGNIAGLEIASADGRWSCSAGS